MFLKVKPPDMTDWHSVIVRVNPCFAAILDLFFLKLIVLLARREITVLIGEPWSQTEGLFESVKQSSITLFRWSAKRLTF